MTQDQHLLTKIRVEDFAPTPTKEQVEADNMLKQSLLIPPKEE